MKAFFHKYRHSLVLLYGLIYMPWFLWLESRANLPYHVIHRLASDGSVKGVGRAVFGWCMERCGNLRVDTHADNTTMLSLLDRLGFTRCGTIYVEDGTPRTAFQWHR